MHAEHLSRSPQREKHIAEAKIFDVMILDGLQEKFAKVNKDEGSRATRQEKGGEADMWCQEKKNNNNVFSAY